MKVRVGGIYLTRAGEIVKITRKEDYKYYFYPPRSNNDSPTSVDKYLSYVDHHGLYIPGIGDSEYDLIKELNQEFTVDTPEVQV